MRVVEPKVYLIAETTLAEREVNRYLRDVDAPFWEEVSPDDATPVEALVEFGGRLCYRSWAPGLNPNVTRVRSGNAGYLANVIESRHGSVLEHASFSFLFADVSRVFTHELVRHRAGCAVSQESMRYVRLTDVPMVLPVGTLEELEAIVRGHELATGAGSCRVGAGDDFDEAPSLADDVADIVARVEAFQLRCGAAIDSLPMDRKKKYTSFMRRLAPDGVATAVLWTVNARALRHVIELRTDPSAEEEIRAVFDRVAAIATARWPGLFGDFERREGGAWVPKTSKA